MPTTRTESAQNLRKRAEEKYRMDEGTALQNLSTAETKKLLHELRVHQIELEMQNEELRTSRLELEYSRTCYFDLYDLAPVGYLTISDEGVILKANLAAATMLGVLRSDLLQKRISRFIYPEDQYVYYRCCKRLTDSGELQSWEIRMMRADGEPFWARLQHTTAQNGEIWLTYTDITAVKKTDINLEAVNKMLQTVIDTVPARIFWKDEELRYMGCNRAIARDAGVTCPEDMIGKDDFQMVWKEQAEMYRADDRSVMKSGVPRLAYEEPQTTLDGDKIWLRTSKVPLRNEANAIIGVLGIYEDITERKNIEEQLMLAHNRAKKASFELLRVEERERERIAGELHDQVGQSLLLAKMKLDILAGEISSDTLRVDLEYATSLLKTSINDIRSLTFRMRPPILSSSGIDAALEWLCSSLQKDYALSVDFMSDGQPKPMATDVSYCLYQAVRELLLNVAKHAKAEAIQLSIKTDNSFIVVQVIDNGIGCNYPEAQLQNRKDDGYGLYNVQNRIEQIGGRFIFESLPGHGTTVTLVLLSGNNPDNKRNLFNVAGLTKYAVRHGITSLAKS